MADPRASRAVGAPVGVLAIAAGAFLAVRPFAAPELMAVSVSLGLAVAALIELVQLDRQRPAKLTLAIGFAVGSLLVGLWQPVSLPAVGAVTGTLLILAGGAELWSAALLSNENWPRLLNSPSPSGFWPSLLFGGAWVVLGSLSVVWVDRTLLPMAVVLGMYLLMVGLAVIIDLVFPAHRLEAPERIRLAGRVLAIVVGSALAFGGIGLDNGRATPGPLYAPIAGAGHAPGKLLRADSYAAGAVPGVVAARLLYVTTSAQGSPIVASAVIYVPADRVTEQLPLVVWAHDGTGLSPACAPSMRGLGVGGMSFADRVAASGYALLAPDLPGLGVEGESSYLIGQAEGRAVLDALRAARQLNGVRFGDAVLWGYGQGGHAALWAGLLRDDYASEVSVKGVAALAPLTDLAATFSASDTGPDGERADSSLISSYAQAYSDVEFNSYVRPTAWLRVRETAARCADADGFLLPQLRALDAGPIWARPVTEGPLAARLAANRPDGRIPVPVLIAQGGADAMVTKDVQAAYVAAQCQRGTAVDYRLYSNQDHDTLVAPSSPAIAELLAWTSDRFDDRATSKTCG